MTAHRRLTALGLGAVTTLSLAACGDDASGGGGPGTRKVALQLTDQGCSPADPRVRAGSVRIDARNPGTTKTDEVELKNADGIILGERENLVPGLSGDFTLQLKPGTYVLNCTFQNDQRDNARLVVTGGAATAAKARSTPELRRGVAAYRAYVADRSEALLAKTKGFVAALRSGDLRGAKDRFGPTRLEYETIEPVAESFGDLDPEIDARVNDVAKRSEWTGFHRIEQILWERGTTEGTARYATELLADVQKLHDLIPSLKLQPAQVANGAVGLLDEVSNSKIGGEEDRYSHTDLSDFQGNLTGARKAFEALEPALRAEGGAGLADQITPRLAEVQKGLDRYRRKTPLGFAVYSELTGADRRRFSQQIDALAEPLSQVAGRLLD